jgi:hypothetical protein
MQRIIFAVALHVVALGCGSGPAPDNGLGFRNRSILTSDEIKSSRVSGWTAHDLISQLRPEYLRSRGPSSLRNTAPVTAAVYVDDIRFGELNSLKTLSADHIFSVQYIGASDATTRFGTDHFGGAILITTK